MNKEELKMKEFDKEQLELLLNDLQDIDKFTGFKDGTYKYKLGKYQANLLVNCIKKYKEVIDKEIEQINDYKIYCENNKGFTEYTDIEIEAIEPVISKLEDILKEVSK